MDRMSSGMIKRLLGRRSKENWGRHRKREIKRIERRQWEEDFTDEQLYPELEAEDD